MAHSDDVLTVDEVAELLRVDRKTVYEAVRRRKLPAMKLGRTIRIARSAVFSLLGSQHASRAQ